MKNTPKKLISFGEQHIELLQCLQGLFLCYGHLIENISIALSWRKLLFIMVEEAFSFSSLIIKD